MVRTVTLVDESGRKTGETDLIDAHTGKGKLHKAFSVYVFNPDRTALLVQQRAAEKMLWPGIWANTCCSHPFENETPREAGERRLKEELGFTCALTEGPEFVYRAEDPGGKGVEHEHVTTLIGSADTKVVVTANPKEVVAYKWADLEAIDKEMQTHPDIYAPWFHLGLPKVLASL